MRYHELALQRWLNTWAIVREGYPVPVVYSSPMDAFGHFSNLWQRDKNPFTYLLDLKDSSGKPLYEPHPSPARYPIISVHRRGWQYRTSQNFSIHRWRHINWPTVSDAGSVIPGKEQMGTGLTQRDLGEVTTARRPMAWDYRFQVDHFCNRPDTQAFFIEQFMQQMWRTGGVPQTWINVPFPGYGDMLVRLYLDGGIENMTPEEVPDGKYTEFRTSFQLVVEGFDVDIRFKVYPALWYVIIGTGGEVSPDQLQVVFTEDLRENAENPTLDNRDIPPPPDTPPRTWHAESEALVLDLNVTSGWSCEGVLMPVDATSYAAWNVIDLPVVMAIDATAAWDVEVPLVPETFDAKSPWDVVDVRYANGASTWAQNFGTSGEVWASHDSFQALPIWPGGGQCRYSVGGNNDLVFSAIPSSSLNENYLACAWHPLTKRVYTRRKNFITVYQASPVQVVFPEITLGPYNPVTAPFRASDLSWGFAVSPTHLFCARGQSTNPSTVCKIDPVTHSIIAETRATTALSQVQGGIIHCDDTGIVYACGSLAGGKIAAIDGATCSILGYLDDSALDGTQRYFRLAYCASTQRLFVTTLNQTKIYVFNLTGGSGYGEWETTIKAGGRMYPIVYDYNTDCIVTAENNGVGFGRLVAINPATLTFDRDEVSPFIQTSWDLLVHPNGFYYLFQNYPGKIMYFPGGI